VSLPSASLFFPPSEISRLTNLFAFAYHRSALTILGSRESSSPTTADSPATGTPPDPATS
jgi:hypothetical protein